jgi:hypothetical protein
MSAAPASLDYTAIAQMFPRHEGTTSLYLNFDGWQSEEVAGFNATTPDDGNAATDERERDIQDIIFRVSEMFSPFDVKVQRLSGNGVRVMSGGATTVFIGDACRFGGGSDNRSGGRTPDDNFDAPGDIHGDSHIPNSNRYDVTFVDPVDHNPADAFNNDRIARVIAHEAGHTFGLGHVLSPPGENAPDLMSYDANIERFMNKWLPLTTKNADGYDDDALPKWHGEDLYQQNSFEFLKAVLGARPADDFGNVIGMHDANVSGETPPFAFFNTEGPGVIQQSLSGVIDRYGDHDVFSYRSLREDVVTFRMQSGSFLGLQSPEILVYSFGAEVNQFSSIAAGTGTVEVSMQVRKGQLVEFVVGGLNGQSVGTYNLTFTAVRPGNPDGFGAPSNEQDQGGGGGSGSGWKISDRALAQVVKGVTLKTATLSPAPAATLSLASRTGTSAPLTMSAAKLATTDAALASLATTSKPLTKASAVGTSVSSPLDSAFESLGTTGGRLVKS